MTDLQASERERIPLSVVGGLGERWSADSARAQEQALPGGRVVVSCGAQLGVGGLGRHLALGGFGALDRDLGTVHTRRHPIKRQLTGRTFEIAIVQVITFLKVLLKEILPIEVSPVEKLSF